MAKQSIDWNNFWKERNSAKIFGGIIIRRSVVGAFSAAANNIARVRKPYGAPELLYAAS